jgi:hypothetical protein
MLPLSPGRRLSELRLDHGVGPSSGGGDASVFRDIHVSHPPSPVGHVSPCRNASSEGSQNPSRHGVGSPLSSELGSEEIEGSLPDSSARPDIDEIFMPPGDMDAARRLAVIFLDPPRGFSSPSGSISRVFCRDMPHLQIELVPSGVGAMYARFHSHHEREAAIEYGDIFMDDVRISLGREETVARAPARVHPWCALIWASPYPVEHVNPIGIRAAFTKVGELLEVDPLCLMGSDLSAVCAIVSLNDPATVPRDLWPNRDGIDTRIPEVVVVRVWPRQNFFVNGTYTRYFAPPPPPPFRHSRLLLPGPSAARCDAAISSPPSPGGGGSSRFSERRLGRDMHRLATSPQPRVLLLTAPPSSLSGSFSAASASASSSMFSPSSGTSVVTDASASPVASVGQGAAVPTAGQATVDDDDGLWESVAGSARNRRKERVREKRVHKHEAARKSARLTGNEAPEYVDAVTKATKRRELRDTLKGCSAILQSHVASSKIMRALKKPLGMKAVAELGAVALGSASMVNDGAHV